jgi:predicted nuclease with TOPRIM domain
MKLTLKTLHHQIGESQDRSDRLLLRLEAHIKDTEFNFREVNERFEQVDRRFDQVDRRFEQIDHRFDQLDRRFDELQTHFTEVIHIFSGYASKMEGKVANHEERLCWLEQHA